LSITAADKSIRRTGGSELWSDVDYTSTAEESELIPLLTGSAADFYIEPMFPHVGDIDVMYY